MKETGSRLTYRDGDLGRRGTLRQGVGTAMRRGVVDLVEAEGLVLAVGDGEAGDGVLQLIDDVQKCL